MIRKVFPVLAVSVFSTMLGVGLIVPLLPLYANEMGASGPELGMIFSGYAIVNTLATPITGRISDRKGRKILLCFGLLFFSITSLSFVLATQVSHLISIRCIQGIAGALVLPIAMAYVGDISPEGEEGKWMGYANAAFFSGFGIGPLLGGAITDRLGRNASFYATSAFCLLAFLIAILLLPEIKHRKATAGANLSLRGIGASATIRGLSSFRLVQGIVNGAFLTFLPIYAAKLGLSPTLIGILIATNMLLMSTLTAVVGKITDRFDRRVTTILGSAVFFASLASIPLARSFWQLMLLSIPRGLGGAVSLAATTAMTVVEGRRFGMGAIMSISMMSLSLGFAIGPPLCGALADLLNINAAFLFGAATGIIGSAFFAWFTRRS